MSSEGHVTMTRGEAKARGEKSYFDGTPCRNGHIARRSTINGQCRECSDARKRNWLAADPARGKRHGRSHYERNRRAYILRAAEWRKNNPDRARESARKNSPKHVDKRRASEAARRMKDPEAARVRVRNRRAKLRAAEGVHSKHDVLEIANAQRYRCAYCPSQIDPASWEVDHIRPLSKGGGNGRRNLQLLCRPCNRSKSAKDPVDFARERHLLL